jgi:hypothetical protein
MKVLKCPELPVPAARFVEAHPAVQVLPISSWKADLLIFFEFGLRSM